MRITGVQILFFDIGNVFVSDDPSGCFAYRQLYERLGSQGVREAVDEFFHRRTEHVKTGGHLWSFVAAQVPKEEFTEFQVRVRAEMYSRWPEMSPAIPGMAEAARELAKHYRLGIIANQPHEVVALLEERGLLRLFEIHGVSADVGFEKPDPRIFEWALRVAKVEPQQAIMIGDRIDNDVKPAKALGMKTLWLSMTAERRGWVPRDEFESCYMASTAQVDFSQREPTSAEEQPDLVARSPDELVRALV